MVKKSSKIAPRMIPMCSLSRVYPLGVWDPKPSSPPSESAKTHLYSSKKPSYSPSYGHNLWGSGHNFWNV
ncbi:unnamed protein product [Linum trigynum]|uniref:Uncharacterized protein n=1 Tax=Linum trigynum TaxID=586398 RepID=A0AAV2EE90_9ROSI